MARSIGALTSFKAKERKIKVLKANQKDAINEIAKRIIKEYPRYTEDKDAFYTLFATLISQRTKDETTYKIAKAMFEKYKTPQEYSILKEEDLYEFLQIAGMYRQKAKRILQIAKILIENYDSKVPDKLEELIKLPGVGRKTANIVLWNSFNINALAVDVHVHRISNRLGWIESKTPEETETKLTQILDEELWGPINGSMVEFGKKTCLPRKPLCNLCSIREYCEYIKGKE